MTRRSHMVLMWSIGGVAAVVLLIVGYFIADHIVRGVIEQKIGDKITAELPDNVSVDPVVTIGGRSAIGQYLAGSFDEVTLEGAPLTVDGVNLDVHIEARGMPVDPTEEVHELSGTLVIDQAALNGWTADAGVSGTVELGDGTIGYNGTLSFFGFEIGYHAAAAPVVDGPWIELEPKTATVTSGSFELNVKRLLGAIADQKVRICAAEHLPAEVSLADIRIQPGEATVRLAATDVVLAQLAAGTTGHCP